MDHNTKLAFLRLLKCSYDKTDIAAVCRELYGHPTPAEGSALDTYLKAHPSTTEDDAPDDI